MSNKPSMLERLQRSFGCDLRTLALFRINLGLLIIVDLVLRTRELRLHYTDFGVLPRGELLHTLNFWGPSLHYVHGSALIQGLLFVVAGVLAIGLIAGYRTRLMTFLCWLILLSLHNRNVWILQGGDYLLLLLLFWGMFLPLGARFSVDQALSDSGPAKDHRFASMATVALLIQCMCVYFFSALLKDAPSYVPDGTAVYEALQLDTYSTALGQWMLNFPSLLEGLTHYVWWLELVGPILIFTPFFFLPTRLALQFMLITMHIGFLLLLKVGFFPFISIVSLLTFTPGAVWDWLGLKLERGGSRPFTVFYDGGCDFCRKLCLLLRTFLILPGMQLKPAQDDERANAIMEEHVTWVVVDSEGRERTKFNALRYLVSLSPVFFWLDRLAPKKAEFGTRFYDWVGANRKRFSRFTATWLPYRDNSFSNTWLSTVAVGIFLLIILRANFASVDIHIPQPAAARDVYRTLRLYQNWNMFAPKPLVADRWIIPVATLNNETLTTVRGDRIEEPYFGKPLDARGFYRTYRQRKFELNILKEENARARDVFANYFCRKWNGANAEEFRIKELKLLIVVEHTEPDNQEPRLGLGEAWSGRCDTARGAVRDETDPEVEAADEA